MDVGIGRGVDCDWVLGNNPSSEYSGSPVQPTHVDSGRRRRRARSVTLLVVVVGGAAIAILSVLALVPLSNHYSSSLVIGESELNVPSNSRVSVSWISNGPLFPDSRQNYVTVVILPSSTEKLSSALNKPSSSPWGNFTFSAGSSRYYIWLYLGPPSGINYTVTYTAPLLSL
jgi:hypothetical protein